MSPSHQEAQSRRGVAGVLVVCALAQLLLLVAHPSSSAHDLASLLREEAADRFHAAVVHAGFVVVLVVQLCGFAALSLEIEFGHTTTIAGYVFFVAGSALLAASIILDGLVVPGVAARYADTGAQGELAIRPVIFLAETIISILMPFGLALQGVGVVFWALRLFRRAPASGIAATLLGIAISAAAFTGGVLRNPGSIMAAIMGTAAWAVLAGAFLMRTPASRG